MRQQVVRNSEGEPMYIENVRDQYEEEEAYCEEMQMRAEDPMYAASQEDAYWYQQAVACFEEKGIEVPEDVIQSLKCELWKKEEKRQEEKALKEVEPTLNYLNEKLPNCQFYANYFPESWDEIAHVEIGCKNRPYRWELAEVIAGLTDEDWNKGISIEDYFSYNECKTLVHGDAGKYWGCYVRSWTAEENCGSGFLFALSKRWLDEKQIPNVPEEERYLQAIWHISPAIDDSGNSLREEFERSHPDCIIWSGEIRHNGDYNDTICFHWS